MGGSPGGLVELKQLHFARSGGTPLCPPCDHPILVTGLISDLVADPHNSGRGLRPQQRDDAVTLRPGTAPRDVPPGCGPTAKRLKNLGEGARSSLPAASANCAGIA